MIGKNHDPELDQLLDEYEESNADTNTAADTAGEEITEAPASEKRSKKSKKEKPPKKHSFVTFLKMLLKDIILCGLILCVFALFHHVIPRFTAKNTPAPNPVSVVTATPAPTVQPEAAPTPGVDPAPTDAAVPEETPEPTPEPTSEPHELTWREKFADKFTDEEVLSESDGLWHYSDKDISVTVTKVRTDYADIPQSNVYVADIYVADINALKTCFATGEFVYYGEEGAEALSRRANAIVAINADYADAYFQGFVVRNGMLYHDEITLEDISVIYLDGTVKNYFGSSYSVEEIVAGSPWQSFRFGPILINDGVIPDSFNTTAEISWQNPRAAFGYYEPGHYCLLVVDGRQDASRGLEIDRLAQFMLDLGCVNAYNLDGGASAVMTFNGKTISKPSSHRDLGDILCVSPLGSEN